MNYKSLVLYIMSDARIHMKTYKSIITMFVVVFSLSPCSVKRDLFDIFDIQYISSLSKIRSSSIQTFNCDSTTETSSKRIAVSKTNLKVREIFPFCFNSILYFSKKDKSFYNNYSGATSGNSPPKYILFKQLKLNVV